MGPGDFELSIGHRFSDPELLRRALTHRSYGASHNERLEYLGDSVVNCVVALELYHKFPSLPEGELSRLRANPRKQPSLPAIRADAVEAVIGAAFLDGGFTVAREVVRVLLGAALDAIDPAVSGKDPKT